MYELAFKDGLKIPIDMNACLQLPEVGKVFRNGKEISKEEAELFDSEIKSTLTYKGIKYEIKSKPFEVTQIEE